MDLAGSERVKRTRAEGARLAEGISINRGLLDRKIYQPIIAKAWQGMIKDCLHPDGFLGYVQGTGKEPKDGQPVSYTSKPDFEDYGLGCFLLAGSEVYKLL